MTPLQNKTLWNLTTDEFTMEFLICSSGNHMYRLMMTHPYIYGLKDLTTDEIEKFYNEHIRSEIKVLAVNYAYRTTKVEPKYNPDMWLTAIAVLIQERTDDKVAGEILKWLDRPAPTVFRICSRMVFKMCNNRYRIRKEWVKHVW